MCLKGANLEESVFAVPAADLWKLLIWKEEGLIIGDTGLLNSVVKKGLFRKRSELEEDPSFKQIIPYAIISHRESFLLFQRKSGQKEKRLHNKLHLGVGGHVNPCRSNEPDAQFLIDELKRELFEEVRLSNDCYLESIEFIGFINDESISVSRVHIGLLYNIRVSNKDVYVNETDKMSATWIEKQDLALFYEEMETWTRIAYECYIK